MCNRYDNEFRDKKLELAKKIGEHTLICWVGHKHRNKCIKKKIYRYDDPKCNIDTLEITGKTRRNSIDTILKMNYSNNEKIFIPEKIENNMYNWRENSLTDAYVDFETIPNFLLENFNTKKEPISKSKGQFIFLIGVWYSYIPKIKQETIQTLRRSSRRITRNSTQYDNKIPKIEPIINTQNSISHSSRDYEINEQSSNDKSINIITVPQWTYKLFIVN